MGQVFQSGTYTNDGTGLLDPSTGQTLAVGSPQSMLAATKRNLDANFTPQLTGNPDNPLANNQSSPLPFLGKPSLTAAATAGALPGSVNVMSPGLNRAGKLLSILSTGLQGAAAGRAASEQAELQSGGRRNGGVGTGFQAGYGLPWQRAQQQQQVALGQAGLQPVSTPYGTLPAELATKAVLPWMIRTQGNENVADIAAGARTQSAQIGAQGGITRQQMANQNRLDVTRLQTTLTQQKGSKYIPDTDETGQPFYHVLNPYGQEIGRTDVSTIPALMSRTSSTVDYQTLDDGSIVALPKTTVSGPNIPGRASTGAGNAPRTVTDANGNPLVAKGTTTSNTKTMIESAPRVLQLVSTLRGQIQGLQQSGDIGPGMSRWSDFWSGKVGTDNPQFRAMMTNADLLSTALQKMHVGARGSEAIMARFDSMLGAGHQSAANMVSALNQIENYANDVKNSAPTATRSAAPQSSGGFDWNSAPRVQ